MNIHVGNLSREVTEAELRKAFESFGQVSAVRIITDRYSGVSKGFGFVEMPKRDEAEAALAGLNMTEFAGRTMDLSEARGPRDRSKSNRQHGGGRGRSSGGRRRF